MHKQKHKHHQKNYNSLKVRLYRIEQMLDKMSRRMQRSCGFKAKAFFKGLGGWWATIKETVMHKGEKHKKKKTSPGSMNKKNKNKTFKPKRGKRS